MSDKRKKILFILGVLDSGGVAKSLVNLVNTVDRKVYDVSLLLVSNVRGPYCDLLPADLNIIHNDVLSAVGSLNGLKYLLLHGHFILAVGTIIRLFVACFSKPWSAYLLSRLMPALSDEYDLIVDYNGQQQTYYMVDKLKGRKKVAFFHSDYSKWPYYYKMDKRYYPKLDAVFTISPICVDALKRFFPEQKDKIHLFENISSLKVINKMAEDSVDIKSSAQWKFLTVGHICKNKGTDLAIEAAALLKKNGLDFVWYFIGNTAELSTFMPLIEKYGLQDNFVFLGLKSNPYPYFKMADIVVHPSLFEGKSITLDEAKLLCKPVVVTNFSTVGDQFENGVNANIVEMNPKAIANGILDLVNNKDKCQRYAIWLQANSKDNVNEIEKLYKLLG